MFNLPILGWRRNHSPLGAVFLRLFFRGNTMQITIAEACFNCKKTIGAIPVQLNEAHKHGLDKEALISSGIDICDTCYTTMMIHHEYVEYCSCERT